MKLSDIQAFGTPFLNFFTHRAIPGMAILLLVAADILP